MQTVSSTPAAEYVRTSTHLQPCSIDTQKYVIAQYAASRGFAVVRTYVDDGKSGLTLNNRPGLASLLCDVANGRADYRAILVYDIARWGRFQDADESAHYEFLCKALNVPVHYCAESFENDSEMSTFILKSLKRTLAAEYSRALSVSCFQGQKNIVERGFRVGAMSGYGLRRMAVSSDGLRQQILCSGEHKSVATDRVLLVPGPDNELDVVRHIFARAAEGIGYTAIAKDLNRRAIPYLSGRRWEDYTVAGIIRNPKYKGWNVWNRTSRKLGAASKPNSSSQWVVVPNAFSPIVSPSTFDRAQREYPHGRRWTREQVNSRAIELIQHSGLSLHSGPCLTTLRRRLIGHSYFRSRRGTKLNNDEANVPTRCRVVILRNKIFDALLEAFPDRLTEFHLPGKSRPLLRLSNGLPVSVLVCKREKRKSGILRWRLNAIAGESQFTTLICLELTDHLRYFLVPGIDTKGSHVVGAASRVFKKGIRLESLAEFYRAARAFPVPTRNCDSQE